MTLPAFAISKLSNRYSIGVKCTRLPPLCTSRNDRSTLTSPNSNTELTAPPSSRRRREAARTRQEFPDAERFGQVIVGAGVQGRDLRRCTGADGARDDRHGRPSAQVAQKVDAVAVWQAEIENDQVRLACARVGQTLMHGLGFMDDPPFALERSPHETPDLAWERCWEVQT